MKHESIIETLEESPRLLRHLVEAAPKARIAVRNKAGVWSIIDHIDHLAQTQIMFAGRIRLFLEYERPIIDPYIPQKEIIISVENTTDELLAIIEEYRKRQLADIRSAPDPVWSRFAEHPEYETYGFEILVRHILLHDFFHMHRIEELAFLKPDNI